MNSALVLIGVLLPFGEWANDATFHPWAHSILGSATLTGDWSGTFVDVHGEPQTAVLTLRRTRTAAGYFDDDGSPLTGELTISGRTRYAVSGRPEWWRGRRVRLRLDAAAPPAPLDSLPPESDAVWHGNSLTLLAREFPITLTTRAQAEESRRRSLPRRHR